MHNLARAIHAMNEGNRNNQNPKCDLVQEQIEREALKTLSHLINLSNDELAIRLAQGEDPSEWMITPPFAHPQTNY